MACVFGVSILEEFASQLLSSLGTYNRLSYILKVCFHLCVCSLFT